MFDKSSKKMLKTCDSKTLGKMEMKHSEINAWLEKNQSVIGVTTNKPVAMTCMQLFG